MYNLEDYDYDLPKELIAQVPASSRDHSRLLVVDRYKECFSDYHFFDLPGLLKPGDLLVVNNTRVIPARLFGRKESGGRIEVLVLEHPDSPAPKPDSRWCLVKSSKRPNKGDQLFFENNIYGAVEDLRVDGLIQVSFQMSPPIDSLLEEQGEMPLPPYIKRASRDRRSPMDRERYQTVFSHRRGAVAAPTAGLHFTEELIKELNKAHVSLVELTLHVGPGTFMPVRTEDVRDHKLGEETYIIEQNTASAIDSAKKEDRRVIAVGTTVVRVLETLAGPRGEIAPGKGKTDLFIVPGFPFKVVKGMITNFHLPKSSLLFLVSAFAGLELIREAYCRAVEKKYRFYSYGDAMLII